MTAPAAAFSARRTRGALLVPAISIAGAAAVMVLVLAATGLPVAAALRALWSGAFGSWYAVTSATLVRAVPLLLAGLAVAVAFRAGVFNVGAEGQLLAGGAAAAALAVTVGGSLGVAALPAALLAGMVAGGAWAGIAAWLRRRFGVLEVISTIMLNFVALNAVGFLVRGPLQEPTHVYPQTETLPVVAQLPRLFAGTRLHWGFVLALVAAVACWFVLRQTSAGFRLRAVGASPGAARTAGGIDVDRVTTRAFLASGALAGLAGAVEVTGVTFALYESLSPGYGYTAIAVALIARLHPLGVVAAAILFGALEAGASGMQRDAGVPSVIVSMVEALIILGLLAAEGTRRAGTTEDR